jgi:hypothetical protein
MTDLLLPPHLRHARVSFSYLDATGISRGMFGAPTKTVARGADRLGATLQFTPHGGKSTSGRSERALLRSFLANLRGRQNRVYLFDKSYRRRGSFPTGELFANNTFVDGATGWTVDNGTLSVSDRIARLTASSGPASFVDFRQSIALTQYAPHVLRSFISDGYLSSGRSIGPAINALNANSYSTTRGYRVVSDVPSTGAATAQYPALINSTSGYLAGTYISISWCSLSRCALADNRPNLLVWSDDLTNAAWTKTNATISNGGTSPDGTLVADFIIENTSSGLHSVAQSVAVSSSAQDYALCVPVAASNRSFCLLDISDGTSFVNQYFNLTGGGSVGANGSTGATWANRRAFTVNMGGGWILCCLLARKTGNATTLTATIASATADGTSSYLGTGVSAIAVWRATLAQSSVPSAIRGTSSIPVASGFAQIGSAITIKGLPPSTVGLLEIDDQVEIITSRGSELKIVIARLDSNAAGLGYLQFTPPLRGSVADNAPVIIHQPMGYFLFNGDQVGWDNEPGFWTSASAEFEEA